MEQDESFEREKIAFEQNYEQLRSVNNHLNNLPTLAITITGGLWFAAGTIDSAGNEIKFMLLVLSSYYNIALIIAMIRVRDIFQSYLELIKNFTPAQILQGFPERPQMSLFKGYSMVMIYSSMMVSTAFSSLFIAFKFYWIDGFSIYYGFIIVFLPVFIILLIKIFK